MNPQRTTFNIGSKRAREARVMSRLDSKIISFAIKALASFLLFCGLVLLLARSKEGLLVLAPAFWLFMIPLWEKNYLRKLPVKENSQSPEELLEWRVLSKIKTRELNAQQLWQIIRGHNQVQFFALRYTIPMRLMDQLYETVDVDMEMVWQRAMEYRIRSMTTPLNAAALFVALFSSTPGSQGLLDAFKLSLEELEAGNDWVAHIKRTLWAYQQREKGGGLARDWSFGYTPILNHLANNISLEVESVGILHRDIDAHRELLDRVIQTLSQSGKANVALVGEPGVGKTTAVYAVANRLIQGDEPKLRYNQIFELNAATLLSQANKKGQLEDMILRVVGEAHHAKNIILFLDEAQLFLQEGTGSVDLTNILLPLIQRSNVRFIMAMNPKHWQRLTLENPALVGLLNYQIVKPTGENDTFKVMEDQTLVIENRHKVLLTYQALREAYHLADHYISEEAFPGKALKVLEDAAVAAGANNIVTPQIVQKTMEQAKGIKIQTATAEEGEKLLNLEDEIHAQMINQERAVRAVSNALRRARAGVRNKDRPIGTFLFLGPTGVGKTQLAKALASVYFGGKDQIVRMDMNEYVQSSDVNKMLDASGVLMSGIRQQPFSVVLLDEIEKAHPDVVNAFLQLLDEGRMSDTEGRVVSFRDAIIIATSNAGADRIREYVTTGQQVADFEERFLDELVEMNLFRPEFLNRFDEMVIFRPLNESELLQVVTLMIAEVNKTLAQQKISVALDEEAKMWLVKRGNDPRLGARPMRRMVQRYVEDIVANRVLSANASPGSVINIAIADFEKVA
jgi:ATP-dependent Clp protease ATP-binding subunit ClpC